MVADYSGALFEGGDALDNFIAMNKNDRGFLRGMFDAVRGLADDLTGREREQARIVAAKLADAINDVNLENENTAQTDGSVKFSLKNKNLTKYSRIPFISLDGYIGVGKKDSAALSKLESAVEALEKKEYTNEATGYSAKITGETIDKAIYPTRKPFNRFKASHILNLNAMLKLPELFSKAVYVDSKNPSKAKNTGKSIQEYHYFVAPMLIGTDTYRTLITAREKPNSNTLYFISVDVLPIQKRCIRWQHSRMPEVPNR